MKNTLQGLLRPAFIRDTIPQQNLIPKSNSYLMKYILIFIIISISLNECDVHGQSNWFRIFGGPRTDQLWNIMTTKDNNIITIGVREVRGPNNIYIPNTCITKFDLYGNKLWQRFISDSAFANYSYSIIEDPSENIYLAVNAGFENISLYKLSSSGTILWNKPLTNTTMLDCNSIGFSQDFKHIIYKGRATSVPYMKICITKSDTSGNVLWSKILFQNDSNETWTSTYNALFVSNEGYYLVGDRYNVNKDYILKLDTNGNYLWSFSNFQVGQTKFGSLVQLSENTFWASGTGSGLYCIKFTKDGILYWERGYAIDTIILDGTKTIRFDDNKIAVTGYASLNGKSSFAVLDTNGNIILKKTHYYNPVTDFIFYNSIDITIDSSFILGGNYSSSYGWDETLECIIVKTDKQGNTQPLKIYDYKEQIIKRIDIYPNPFNSSFKITIDYPDIISDTEIKIYNILGSEVFYKIEKLVKGKNNLIIDFTKLNLPSSIYFLKIKSKSINYHIKLIYIK